MDNILTKDLFEYKFFKILVGIGIVVIAILYIISYNSPEAKCKRRYDKITTSSVNKLDKHSLDAAKEPLIQKCIEESKR